jgi:hypothetical protein
MVSHLIEIKHLTDISFTSVQLWFQENIIHVMDTIDSHNVSLFLLEKETDD